MEKMVFVGLRRQDKSIWERRSVLTPKDIKHILSQNPFIKFLVQPSKLRIFSDLEYQHAGAKIQQDLSQCELIIGVKQIPAKYILPNKTYLFFSHVIKAQSHNMEMLDVILNKKVRLIDYQKICDNDGKRLIAFGVFAGLAGAIDFLAGFGLYLLHAGYSTPFLNINYSYKYLELEDAYHNIKRVSKKLLEKGIQKQLRPLIFAVTGRGRTANGVLEVLGNLPIKMVHPDEIQKLVEHKDDPAHISTIYVTNINTQDVITPRDQSLSKDKNSYYKNPQKYKNIFNKKYLPYISCLFHCIFWDSKCPKYIKNKHLAKLAQNNNLRLLGICDVTCDSDGSIECLKNFTSPDKPFFFYDPIRQQQTSEFEYQKNRIMYLAVDFLPCQLAYDATVYFSNILKKWIPNICLSDRTKPLSQQGLVPQIERAVIANDGVLTPPFEYISKLRIEKAQSLRRSNKNSLQIKRQKTKISQKAEDDLGNSLHQITVKNLEQFKKFNPVELTFEEDV